MAATATEEGLAVPKSSRRRRPGICSRRRRPPGRSAPGRDRARARRARARRRRRSTISTGRSRSSRSRSSTRRQPRRRRRKRASRRRRARDLDRLAPALPQGHRQGRPADRRPGGRAREAHRARRPRREAGDGRGEPPPRRLDREALSQPGAPVPRPDPGGNDRPRPRGREVRLAQGLQVLDVCDVVDPAGGRPRARRQGPHDPDARPCRREAEQDRPLRAQAARRALPRADCRSRSRSISTSRSKRSSRSCAARRRRSRSRSRSATRRSRSSATSSPTRTCRCPTRPPRSRCARRR